MLPLRHPATPTHTVTDSPHTQPYVRPTFTLQIELVELMSTTSELPTLLEIISKNVLKSDC